MRSMTGFGKGSSSDGTYEVTVELRSVNNRYLETLIRMPKEFSVFENNVRNWLKDELVRGKVNVFISVSRSSANTQQAIIDPQVALKLSEELNNIRKELQIPEPVTINEIINYYNLSDINLVAIEEDEFKALLEPAVKEALQQLNEMRAAEGANLQKDMQARLENISALSESVEERAKTNVQEVFNKMVQNVTDLIGQQKIDQSRLEQEIALISDRVDITEECVRMQSHIKLFNETIEMKDEKGKKLTFILQEMLREANTMNSKNARVEIQHQVIQIKEEIEKIREQAQNIE